MTPCQGNQGKSNVKDAMRWDRLIAHRHLISEPMDCGASWPQSLFTERVLHHPDKRYVSLFLSRDELYFAMAAFYGNIKLIDYLYLTLSWGGMEKRAILPLFFFCSLIYFCSPCSIKNMCEPLFYESL